MFKKNRELYLANLWPEIVTKRGAELLLKKGWQVKGNWLDHTLPSDRSDVILLPPASYDDAISLNVNDYKKSLVFPHLLFPDQLVGWNNEENRYLLKPTKQFADFFKSVNTPVLSHSQFSSGLALTTYPEIKEIINTYLPIDFKSIAAINRTRTASNRLKVLWNNMWRSDKGVVEAFQIIDSLSGKYKMVDFYIGRNNRWGNKPDAGLTKKKCLPLLNKLKKRNNVYFSDTFPSQNDYYNFLRDFDIGFSCSYHEGFGLSILEQAAAGLACVVPNKDSYPEVLPDALLSSPNNIEKSLTSIIENQNIRKNISLLCQENAKRFDVVLWVNRILGLINQYSYLAK